MVETTAVPTAVEKLVKVAADFHFKTGVDLELIKQFIKEIGDITSEFTLDVVREQVNKTLNN